MVEAARDGACGGVRTLGADGRRLGGGRREKRGGDDDDDLASCHRRHNTRDGRKSRAGPGNLVRFVIQTTYVVVQITKWPDSGAGGLRYAAT